jgi:osmotically-inducible protein OsmY
MHSVVSLSDRFSRAVSSVVLLAAAIGLANCAHGPTPPVGTVAMSLDEARVAAAARSALINDPQLGLRAITVEVKQHVVTLRGVVRTQAEVEHAEQIVRKVDGVTDVRAMLRVQPEDDARGGLVPTYQR